MKKSLFFVAACATLFLASCGAEEEAPAVVPVDTQETEVVEEAAAIYKYDHSSTQVKWTAYKLPGERKAGVQGQFDSIAVSGFTEGEDAIAAMTGVEFQLFVGSTSTGDTARDGKIINSFFGTMLNTQTISGTIKSLSGGKNGTGIIAVKMNDLEQDFPVEYKIENGTEVMIWGTMDVPAWNGQAALDALNAVCNEKHEGVTWPDVDIKVFTTLIKE